MTAVERKISQKIQRELKLRTVHQQGLYSEVVDGGLQQKKLDLQDTLSSLPSGRLDSSASSPENNRCRSWLVTCTILESAVL